MSEAVKQFSATGRAVRASSNRFHRLIDERTPEGVVDALGPLCEGEEHLHGNIGGYLCEKVLLGSHRRVVSGPSLPDKPDLHSAFRQRI